MVNQQHRIRRGGIPGVSRELRGVGQAGDITIGEFRLQLTIGDQESGDVRIAARTQRDDVVEETLGVADDFVAADGVVTRTGLRAALVTDDVGSVEGVVQRPPARVGGIEREARIEDRHHQLWPRRRRDLGVDTRGGDGEVGGFGEQVADIGQELPVLGLVDTADDPLTVPLVDLRLQIIAAGK